jgi:RNA polymerase sigma factor (sigma-70 family)
MVERGLDVVVGHAHRVAAGSLGEQRTDPELLRQFAHGRDEGAFAALVRRHGPMVMRVCLHVLHQEQDAEDAFQVTFLVLARNPAAIRKAASLASWLHGVAYRTARTARRSASTRQRHEARAETMSTGDATQELVWREVQAILEEEVQALPEVYRAAFILCQMEGRSGVEAARELRIKEGTVSSRLDRARKQLRVKLATRGVALSAVLGAMALAAPVGAAAVPRRLLDATVRAGMAHAAGSMTSGSISASAEVLLRAVTRTPVVTPGKVVTALLAAVLVVAGVATAPDPLLGQQRDQPQTARSDTLAAAAAPPGQAAGKAAQDALTVSGQVHDPEGKPFPGAEVTVRWHWSSGERAEPRVKTTSGPGGRFRVRFARSDLGTPRLAPDVDPYHFSPLQVVASAKGYGPGWVYVQSSAQGEGLTLRLVRDDVPITGRVLDVQLRPVKDAVVRVIGAGDEAPDPWPGLAGGVTTNKDGRFVLAGIGRDRAVRLSVEGPTIERKTVEISTARASTATVEVVARPTRVMQGTVRAEDTGKPLAGVVVRGGEQQGRYTGIYTLTDAQGRYRLVGLPKGGSYTVTAWPSRGQTYIPRTATVGDSQGLKPITVDFRLQRGVALRVRLVDRGTGKPVRGMVFYDPLANNASRPALQNNGRVGSTLWQFPASYPDRDGYCHLVAPPGPGVVVGKGHDIPYLTRPIDPADAKAYPVLTKAPFLLGGLQYHYSDLFQSYRVFDARAGDRPLDLEIDLGPGWKVEGKLVGPDARPVTGAVAFGLAHSPQNVNNYSYRNEPAYRARVESQALQADRFVTAGLTAGGARTVTFLHAGRKLIANVVVRAAQKGPLTVRLEPWGAVTGRVVDANGDPLAGVTVELLYPSQQGLALLMPGTGGVAPGLLAPGRPFRTNARGRFRVEGLIPGQKHQLTFPGLTGTLLTPGAVKDLSTRAGEVRDQGDIKVRVTPPKREKGGQP